MKNTNPDHVSKIKLIYTNVSPCLNATSEFKRHWNPEQLSLKGAKEKRGHFSQNCLGKAFRVDRRLVIRDIERDPGISCLIRLRLKSNL